MEIGSSSRSPESLITQRQDYTTDFGAWRTNLDKILLNHKVRYVLSEQKPTEPTITTPEIEVARHQKWPLDDFTARHVILGALHQRVYASHHRHETAKSLIDARTHHFTQPSMSRKVTRLRRYVQHKMAEGKSVNEHISEMETMASELEREGVKVSDELQAVMLVNSLPDSWDQAVLDEMSSDSLEKVSMRLRETALKRQQHRMEEIAEANIYGCCCKGRVT